MADLFISATVLTGAVLLIRLTLGRRLPAAVRYALWLVVLARLLIPVQLFQSPVSVLNTVPQRAERPAAQAAAGEGAAEAEPWTPRPAEGLRAPTPQAPRPGVTAREAALAVYALGAGAVGLGFLVSNARFALGLFRARRRVDEVEGVAVYRAAFLRSPCLAGLLRPAIYLPDGVGEARMGHVLAHELCHRRHGDNWWALLRCAALCLWWFHPLVWAAAVLSRRDCELCCDASALRMLGEEERIPYGETLVALASGRGAGELLMASTAMTAGRGELGERIRQIAKRPKVAWGVLLLALVLVGGALCATFTGRDRGAAAEPPQPTPPGAPAAESTGRKMDYGTFLLLGQSDTGTVDTVIAASYDAGTGTLSLVSIPRDLYVDAAALRLSGLSAGGAEAIQGEMERQLGIPFDSYIQVDPAGMADIIDAMGGVDYDVKRDMDYDDEAQNLSIHLKKGPQHLTGEQAVMVAQYRRGNDNTGYPDGDLGRIRAQQELLTALVERAASLEDKLGLAKAAVEHLRDTSLKLQELLLLVSDVKGQGDSFTVRSALLPVKATQVWDEAYQSNQSVCVAEAEEALDMVNQMLNPYVAPRTLEDMAFAQPKKA